MDPLETTEDVLGFNFWPAFADLMLSLVLILVFFYVATVATGVINMRNIRDNQLRLINDISEMTGKEKREREGEASDIYGWTP